MKKTMAKKVLAATMAAAMTMSLAACGAKPSTSASASEPASTPASTSEVASVSEEPSVEEPVEKYTVKKDANGNAVDLGGMEITIRDWFSSEWRDNEPATEYEEAVYDYRQWCEETYNFTMHTATMGDWGSCANDFVDYVSAGGDDVNYVWTVFSGNATFLEAAKTGLAYDLSTIDCIDFADKKYNDNGCHKVYTLNGGVFGMHTGPAEPRTGVIFNRRLLTEAGIDPDSLYDMQANGTWDWNSFEEMCAKVQRDVDNDGTTDIWAIAVNEGVGTSAAVFSNGGCYVGQDADGKYTYEIENPKTVEALEWILGIYQKYDWNGPADEEGNAASWDYYQNQFKTGGAAFCFDQQYCFTPGNLFYDMEDELGFVMFPKGPQGDYIQTAQDNVYAIPGCYDADRAWKIAFAYDVFNEYVPGYEDYNSFMNTTITGNVDERAAETVAMMGGRSTVELQNVIPNSGDFMNAPLTWAIGPDTTQTISEILDGVRDIAKAYIEEANN